MVDTLSRELHRLGHIVKVATSTADSNALEFPYEVIRIDSASPKEDIQRIIDFAPDVVHVHNLLDNSLVLLSSIGLAAKFVATFHNEHRTSSESAARTRFRWVNENVDELVAVSEFVKRSITRSGDFPSISIHTIFNGTSTPASEAEIGNHPGKSIVFMGRISPEKGLGYLLSSMLVLVQKHSNVRLQVLGEGPFRRTFEKFVKDFDLEDNVTFLGWQTGNERTNLLSRARFVVVPSAWKEPFGLVAIEAMMHGKPVIVTDRGGLTELVEHGVTGFIVQPGDILELAARMSQLLTDDSLAEAMGIAGHARAIEHFTITAAASKYLKLYEGCGEVN